MVAPAALQTQVLARLHSDEVADRGHLAARAGESFGDAHGDDAPRIVLVGEAHALEGSFNG